MPTRSAGTHTRTQVPARAHTQAWLVYTACHARTRTQVPAYTRTRAGMRPFRGKLGQTLTCPHKPGLYASAGRRAHAWTCQPMSWYARDVRLALVCGAGTVPSPPKRAHPRSYEHICAQIGTHLHMCVHVSPCHDIVGQTGRPTKWDMVGHVRTGQTRTNRTCRTTPGHC